jgi:hypothetical protein
MTYAFQIIAHIAWPGALRGRVAAARGVIARLLSRASRSSGPLAVPPMSPEWLHQQDIRSSKQQER